MSKPSEHPISKDLLEILVCPLCKADLDIVKTKDSADGLKCSACKRIYPIREGIPIMLPDEARTED